MNQETPVNEQEFETAADGETIPPAKQEKTDAEKLSEMRDQLLRALADAENTRRIAQKEREETSKYAVTNFARDMLAIADNFQRALASMPKDLQADAGFKNLMTGIEATERQMIATFERFGIKKIDAIGQMFDPHQHRVMMEVAGEGKPAGTIMQILQPGYVIHDRLLREALVAVAKKEE